MTRLSLLVAAGALLLRGSLACRATEELALDAEAAVLARFASAAPVPEDKTGLRLLKTSEDDEGTWVTEEEKISEYMLKHVHFMDVTETQDLEALGQARVAEALVAKRQTTYPAPSRQAVAAPIIARLVQANVQSTITGLSAIYNRYYRGSYAATSATYVLNLVKTAASANPAITVRQFTHSFNQPSVIATIPGTSTARRVVVGAHFDSINQASVTGRAPGADDNASGVATILEALRALAVSGYAPGITLEFHFYAGEEGGLLGARDIFNNYATNKINVVAVLNQDMTGYSTNNVIAVYTDYVDSALTTYVQSLVPVYTGLKLVTDKCGYGCSDHAAARAAGYAASYVCADTMTDSSPYIHTTSDTAQSSFYAHALQHSKLTVGFLVEASFW